MCNLFKIGILWSRDGKRLDPKPDPRYTIREEILSNGVLSDLSVKRSERTDSALFTCVATNAFGSDETSLNLIVQGELSVLMLILKCIHQEILIYRTP